MKVIFALFLTLFMVNFSYSDQLAWITKDQAEQTVEYFRDNDITQVILWCACCDNDPKILVSVNRVFYKPAEGRGYYEVYIEGTNALLGQVINEPVDLAYVHIKRGGKWRCLGKELKFDCDPCTKSFKY